MSNPGSAVKGSNEIFEGYVTKYALTSGIQKLRLELTSQDGVTKNADQSYGDYYHGEGRDWHRTYASAYKRAEQMRKAKIASLEKSIAKLSKPFPEQAP